MIITPVKRRRYPQIICPYPAGENSIWFDGCADPAATVTPRGKGVAPPMAGILIVLSDEGEFISIIIHTLPINYNEYVLNEVRYTA
jgi:hypothetical protein